MTVPHDEQLRVVQMRANDYERQVWMYELEREAEEAAANASGAENIEERLANHDRQIIETKARHAYWCDKLAELEATSGP